MCQHMNSVLNIARAFFFLICVLWMQSERASAQPTTPLTFRTLLIVKPIGDIHSEAHLPVRYKMTPEDIAAITVAFRDYVPYWINRISNGRIKWQAEVKVSDVPLRTLKTWDDGCGITPEDISEDLDEWVPQGKYDAVFIYWKSWDDQTNYRLPGPYGWASGTFESANWTACSSVQYDVPGAWGRDSGSTECFIHEWEHLLEGFYGNREGVRLARGGVHGGEEHGYKLNERNWKDWYGDLLLGQIKEDDGLKGLGEPAWKYGLPREQAARKPAAAPRRAGFQASASKLANDELRASPTYLTPERRAKNLLVNGDFSLGDDGSWEIRSYKNNLNAAQLLPDVPSAGQNAIGIATTEADDIKIVQKVKVKPRTNYYLSGWIATQGVQIVQENGQFGANIGWLEHAERSPDLLGDNKWRFVSTGFYSGGSTEVEICAHLGGIASTSVGKVMFRDLCLLEVAD